MHRGLFATVALLVVQITVVSRNFDCLSISTGTIVSVCFDKNMVRLHHNASASDFIGVILHFCCTKQTHFAMISPVLFASWCLLLLVLPLNWIHSKTISAATFHKIELTKIPKIEFLPLDWIYRSIRIRTVLLLQGVWPCESRSQTFLRLANNTIMVMATRLHELYRGSS